MEEGNPVYNINTGEGGRGGVGACKHGEDQEKAFDQNGGIFKSPDCAFRSSGKRNISVEALNINYNAHNEQDRG